jgi:hypothetical protein
MLIGPALMRVRFRAGAAVAVAVSLVLAFTVVFTIGDRVRDLTKLDETFDELTEASGEAASRMAGAGPPVFGDRNDLTIAAGQGPTFDNVPMTLLAAGDKWDTGPLVEMIRRGQFRMIQAGFDLKGELPELVGTTPWPPEVVSAVDEAYCESWHTSVPSSTGPGLWLYEPCDGQPG